MNTIISSGIFLYSSILECLRICLSPLLKKLSDRYGWDLPLRQRLPVTFRDFRNRTVVWIHAASLGESKLLIKFLETLTRKHPEDLYLITAATRDGVNYIHAHRTPGVCAAGFLPLDTIPLMKKVIEQFSINRLWIIETELWPSLLWVCRNKKISVGIVNARIEEKTFTWYNRFKNVLSYLFETVDIILAQTQDYGARYNALGVNPSNIHIVGNIKGHISITRPPKKEWLSIRTDLNIKETDQVLVAGCVHAGEGAILAECFKLLSKSETINKMIIIPRHSKETAKIADETGREVLTLSDIRTSQSWNICIVNRTGILDDMYKCADAAFIGGTFINTGGHNVWDAARYGIPVFFGPDYSKQLDGCETLLTNGVGFKVHNATELAEMVYRVLKKEASKFMHAQRLFIDTMNRRQSLLEPLIP
ncbi:MAG TPA: glycosyltransferase N-terminal domain-containing protein [Chitinispirillaceae bacterium]|nr:glycosyltransferase N-terminal domain-containing protein [Chitinispirillaceae bacterium]